MKLCSRCKHKKESSEFYNSASSRSGLRSNCKDCCRATKEANPNKEKTKIAYAPRKREYARVYHRRYRLLKQYGLTVEAYEQLKVSQGGACEICKRLGLQLCPDHDHETGVVRSLLCSNCNAALGLLGDSASIVTAAANYLTRHGKI